MADCFSLPNAAELVEELKRCADCAGGYCTEFCGEKLFEISDFVEALLSENAKLQEKCDKCGDGAHSVIKELIEQNAKLKAERDAAVEDMERIVNNMLVGCEYCKKGCTSWKDCHFEWRGVKEDTDAEEWRGLQDA